MFVPVVNTAYGNYACYYIRRKKKMENKVKEIQDYLELKGITVSESAIIGMAMLYLWESLKGEER